MCDLGFGGHDSHANKTRRSDQCQRSGSQVSIGFEVCVARPRSPGFRWISDRAERRRGGRRAPSGAAREGAAAP